MAHGRTSHSELTQKSRAQQTVPPVGKGIAAGPTVARRADNGNIRREPARQGCRLQIHRSASSICKHIPAWSPSSNPSVQTSHLQKYVLLLRSSRLGPEHRDHQGQYGLWQSSKSKQFAPTAERTGILSPLSGFLPQAGDQHSQA